MRFVATAFVLLGFGAWSASAAIYDNLFATDGQSTNGGLNQPVLDDLQVSGGGVLSDVSFALLSNGDGETATTDIRVTIFLDMDTEDGLPSPNDPGNPSFNGVDPLLFQRSVRGVTIPTGTPQIMTFSGLESENIVIPEGASLWAGIGFAVVSQMEHAFYGSPSPGATDGFTYQFSDFAGWLSRSVPDSETFPNSAGLGWRLNVIPEPGSLVLLLVGAAALSRRRDRVV